NRKDSPGCAVGISRNGAIAYERGYGMADIELGVPMTPSTVLAVASVSKSLRLLASCWPRTILSRYPSPFWIATISPRRIAHVVSWLNQTSRPPLVRHCGSMAEGHQLLPVPHFLERSIPPAARGSDRFAMRGALEDMRRELLSPQ